MDGISRPGRSRPREDVEALLASLEHPFEAEIRALRTIVLGADPGITEGIKWNAPSFRTSVDFATFQLRARDGVQLILHFGAKKRNDLLDGVDVPDPESILAWLAPDRASATFRDLADIEAKREAFVELVRVWIDQI